jgi:DNA-directed RNA polymerase subunit beta'
VIFSQIWPAGLGFINFPVAKGKLGDLILNTYKVAGPQVTVETLDKLKELGFKTAAKAGISIGIDDMIIPESKKDIVGAARKKIDEVENQYKRGIITTGERYNKIIDIWTGATDQIAKAVFAKLESNEGKPDVNPVYLMMDSGARGNKQQVRQLCGTRAYHGQSPPRDHRTPILPPSARALVASTSSPPRRPKVSPTPPSRPDAGYLTRSSANVARTALSPRRIAAPATASGRRPIYDGDDEIVSSASAVTAAAPATTSRNRTTRTRIHVASGEHTPRRPPTNR